MKVSALPFSDSSPRHLLSSKVKSLSVECTMLWNVYTVPNYLTLKWLVQKQTFPLYWTVLSAASRHCRIRHFVSGQVGISKVLMGGREPRLMLMMMHGGRDCMVIHHGSLYSTVVASYFTASDLSPCGHFTLHFFFLQVVAHQHHEGHIRASAVKLIILTVLQKLTRAKLTVIRFAVSSCLYFSSVHLSICSSLHLAVFLFHHWLICTLGSQKLL